MIDRFTVFGQRLEDTEPDFAAYFVRFADYNSLRVEIDRLRAEVNEQARLLGMSGSREAALLARLADLEAEHAAFSNNVEQCEAENDRLRARLEEARGTHLSNINLAISCFGQIYGAISDGDLDKAGEMCRASAETFTQDIAALERTP